MMPLDRKASKQKLTRSKAEQKSQSERTEVVPKQPLPLKQKSATLIYDGKEITLPILKSTEGNEMIDIRKLLGSTGLTTYDPGFTCTASCMSAITFINGEKGELRYRGYAIDELAEKSSFVQTCYLLLYGQLPAKKQLEKFEEALIGEMAINERMVEFYKGFKSDSHPMAIMVGVVGALSAFLHGEYDYTKSSDRHELAIKMIAKMPTIAAYAYRTSMGLPVVRPKKKYSYMKNFLYMMFSNPMEDDFTVDDSVVRAMEVIWMCHADHEQNASTSTVRIAGSSLANPFACIAAGIGSLWGPFHGGANQAVLLMLQTIRKDGFKIEEVIEKAKDKNSSFRLMGFGHRVYKNFDPRAKIMQKMCHQVLKTLKKTSGSQKQISSEAESDTHQLLNLAISLQKAALQDPYFIERKLYPNVDFYTGIVYKAIGIPQDMFTVMFAVSRSAGWMSQWNQMMSESSYKLSRPRQLYVGENQRKYEGVESRKIANEQILKEVSKLLECSLGGGSMGNVKI